MGPCSAVAGRPYIAFVGSRRFNLRGALQAKSQSYQDDVYPDYQGVGGDLSLKTRIRRDLRHWRTERKEVAACRLDIGRR